MMRRMTCRAMRWAMGPRMCVKWAAVMGSVAMRIQVIDELVLPVFEELEEDVMV